MVFSKFKRWLRKTFSSEQNTVASSLREENADLKKAVAELSRRLSEHQLLKSSASGESAPTYVAELENRVSDALGKNRMLVHYAEQRETHMRSVVYDNILLKKQLIASQADSQQHKEDSSDEKNRVNQVQQRNERLEHETKDLQHRLDQEKHRSADLEQQLNFYQRYMVNQYHAYKDKIADLEQQLKITSENLEEKKQFMILKRKNTDRVTNSQRDGLTSSPRSSLADECSLERSGCRAQHPATRHRDLMKHIDICLS